MLTTWVVICQLNTGKVYGWLCQAATASQAEKEFWNSLISTEGRQVKCIGQLRSDVADALFALYQEDTHG